MIDGACDCWYHAVVLAPQRRAVILRALERGPFIGLQDAVVLTGASEATVRRDFAILEEAGRLHRHRGGVEAVGAAYSDSAAQVDDSGAVASHIAISAPPAGRGFVPLASTPLESRVAVREEAKRLIAERAARLVEEGQTLFLDAGSTALALASQITGLAVRVVTNSFAAARVLLTGNATEVVITGGQIDPASEVVVSYVGDPILESYPPDIAFIGAQGIDESGVSNSDERLIRTERLAVLTAVKTVLIADSSKIGVRGRVRVCALNDVTTLVTDAGMTPEQRGFIEGSGCGLIEVR